MTKDTQKAKQEMLDAFDSLTNCIHDYTNVDSASGELSLAQSAIVWLACKKMLNRIDDLSAITPPDAHGDPSVGDWVIPIDGGDFCGQIVRVGSNDTDGRPVVVYRSLDTGLQFDVSVDLFYSVYYDAETARQVVMACPWLVGDSK